MAVDRPEREALPAHAQAGFEKLRRQFAAGLAARQAEIDASTDDDARAAALHRLAGAAGGYGFADIDAAARHALRLVERGERGRGLDAALHQLRQHLARHGPS